MSLSITTELLVTDVNDEGDRRVNLEWGGWADDAHLTIAIPLSPEAEGVSADTIIVAFEGREQIELLKALCQQALDYIDKNEISIKQ